MTSVELQACLYFEQIMLLIARLLTRCQLISVDLIAVAI